MELNPGMAAAWSNLAGLALGRGDADAAAELAERAVAAGGGAEACLTHARALDSLGKTEQAVVAYRQAVAAAPASTVALNNLGSLLERSGRLDEAAAVFRRALKIEAGAPVLLFNLGVVLGKMGSRDDAVATLRAAEQAFRAAGNEAMAQAAADRLAGMGAARTNGDQAAGK